MAAGSPLALSISVAVAPAVRGYPNLPVPCCWMGQRCSPICWATPLSRNAPALVGGRPRELQKLPGKTPCRGSTIAPGQALKADVEQRLGQAVAGGRCQPGKKAGKEANGILHGQGMQHPGPSLHLGSYRQIHIGPDKGISLSIVVTSSPSQQDHFRLHILAPRTEPAFNYPFQPISEVPFGHLDFYRLNPDSETGFSQNVTIPVSGAGFAFSF